MKKQDLIKQFESIRSLEPDPGFVSNSKNIICAVKPERGFGIFRAFQPAFLGSFAVMVAVVMGAYFVGSRGESTLGYTSLNGERISNELDGANIDIELQELAYKQSINSAVASALQEIGNDRVSHLNGPLLKSESAGFSVQQKTDETGTKIENLLDAAMF